MNAKDAERLKEVLREGIRTWRRKQRNKKRLEREDFTQHYTTVLLFSLKLSAGYEVQVSPQ